MSTPNTTNVNQKEINRRWALVFWFNLYATQRLGTARGSFSKKFSSSSWREFAKRLTGAADMEFVIDHTDERFRKVAEDVRDYLREKGVL